MSKVCRECGEEKDASAFYSSLDSRDEETRLSAACRPCTAVRLRRWRRENSDRVNANQREYATVERREAWPSREPGRRRESDRTSRLPRKYGITVEVYDAMLEAQGGVCAICRRPETMVMKGTVAALAVDHDPVTGEVRGLLCFDCNTGIGKLGHDPELLLGAVEYLLGEGLADVLPEDLVEAGKGQ